jgi:hypothetical protein
MVAMIRAQYIDVEVLRQMREHFVRSGSLVIDSVFERSVLRRLSQQLGALSFREVHVPNRHRYSFYRGVSSVEVASLCSFVSNLLGRRVIFREILRFGSRDYTLRSDFEQVATGEDVFFFVLAGEWCERFGGAVTYTSLKGLPQLFIPLSNRLCIVRCTREMQSFVQYINSLSETKSFFLLRFTVS